MVGLKLRGALALSALLALVPPATHAAPATVPELATMKTEEGQTVAFDAYSWQRRELDKRLPLTEPFPNEFQAEPVFKRFGLDKTPALITAPARIAKDLYLVNATVNHTYLIDAGPEGLILIDPGMDSNVERILANTEALGFSRSAIKWVINTHAHFDHSMADAAFQKLGAKILIGRADAPHIEKGTQVTAKYVATLGKRPYPTVKVDWPVDDGEELHLGDKMILAIATPGHTPGSTCYMLTIDGKNILFGGDTLLYDYRLGAQTLAFADNAAYLASLKKVEHFMALPGGYVRWDMLMPGHGAIVMDRAYMDVAKAVRQVEWDQTVGEEIKALPFADDYYRKLMFGRP